MRGENVLYETIYQSILTQIYSGVLRCGQTLPSQRELCLRYHVGITTVRKVVRMLERDGVIETASGKRAVVCHDGRDEACIAALLRRRESILDIYGGLELLMPALYAHGALYCADHAGLRLHLAPIGGGMEQGEIYERALRFFMGLLAPYRNPVALELQSDMEHYSRVPYMASSGLADPFAITADYARENMLDIQAMAERGSTAELTDRLARMYRDAGVRAEHYLDGLARQYPPGQERAPYQWFSGKGRAHLYAMVARSLYRRIQSGEFAHRAYLPSVPEIMQTYGVSKDTACNAVALLSDIGLIRTLDKRGAVLREGGKLPPMRLEGNVVGDHLVLCVDAMQILAVCAGRLSFAASSTLDGEAIRTVVGRWRSCPEPVTSTRAVQMLLDFLRRYVPFQCLKSILEQFDDLLIWGHYLERLKVDAAETQAQESEIQANFTRLSSALAAGDLETFSSCFQTVFGAAYQIARTQTLRRVPPERLPIALELAAE